MQPSEPYERFDGSYTVRILPLSTMHGHYKTYAEAFRVSELINKTFNAVEPALYPKPEDRPDEN